MCVAFDACTHPTAAATWAWGARPHLPHEPLLAAKLRPEPVARIVVPYVQCPSRGDMWSVRAIEPVA